MQTKELSPLIRFGVSLEENLLKQFDRITAQKGYTGRSEAIRDLMRESLVKEEWKSDREVAAVFTLVYDHHQRDLVSRMAHLEHENGNQIIATTHAHLDHHNCLQVILMRGEPRSIQKFADQMRSLRGVKYGSLSPVTTGQKIP